MVPLTSTGGPGGLTTSASGTVAIDKGRKVTNYKRQR